MTHIREEQDAHPGQIAVSLGLAFGLVSGLGAALMIYADARSRSHYGENWDCMVMILLGGAVFWPSLLISAISFLVGLVKRNWIGLIGLAGLGALFATLWFTFPG